MEIKIKELLQGAREAQGLTVIIDVFRAFSVACYAFDNGVKRLINVATTEDAFRLKKNLRADTLLVGEKDERKPEGFDLGNSPTEILTGEISGKTMIHCTTAGTNGIINAWQATEILGASLVNAGAVARYIRMKQPETVTLVAMGYRATERADEDLLCANYIMDKILGRENDVAAEINKLRTGSGKRFFEPANIAFSPPTDFFLCTEINRFDFILKAVVTSAGHAEILRVDIHN